MKKGDKKDRNANNANKFDLVSGEIQNVCCFTTFKCKTNVR